MATSCSTIAHRSIWVLMELIIIVKCGHSIISIGSIMHIRSVQVKWSNNRFSKVWANTCLIIHQSIIIVNLLLIASLHTIIPSHSSTPNIVSIVIRCELKCSNRYVLVIVAASRSGATTTAIILWWQSAHILGLLRSILIILPLLNIIYITSRGNILLTSWWLLSILLVCLLVVWGIVIIINTDILFHRCMMFRLLSNCGWSTCCSDTFQK